MRLILFFDLPMVKASEVKAYTRFLKELKKEGFLMLQYSVYTKLAITGSKAEAVVGRLKKIIPSNGTIDILVITEKQYASIITLLGDHKSDIINNDERFIEL